MADKRAAIKRAARNLKNAVAAYRRELKAERAKASPAQRRAIAQKLRKLNTYANRCAILDFGAKQCGGF